MSDTKDQLLLDLLKQKLSQPPHSNNSTKITVLVSGREYMVETSTDDLIGFVNSKANEVDLIHSDDDTIEKPSSHRIYKIQKYESLEPNRFEIHEFGFGGETNIGLFDTTTEHYVTMLVGDDGDLVVDRNVSGGVAQKCNISRAFRRMKRAKKNIIS